MVIGRTGGVSGPQPIQPSSTPAARKAYASAPPAKSDTAEISLQARYLKKLHELPAIREDRVERLREQILDGTYDTEEKMRAAVERILDELG